MTTNPKGGDPGKRRDGPDFDLVEDIGDDAAFDRALDELLPKADLPLAPRHDIDPDDFEAFNRELDAQMAQAKARVGRFDDIEDLGTDILACAPPPRPGAETAAPRAAAALPQGPELADDVVTLGTIAAAMAAPAAAEPPAPAVDRAPPPPSAPAAVPPASPMPRSGRGPGVVAAVLGLAGLVAGGAALWLSLEREAELARLQAALGERQEAAAAVPAPPPPAPAPDTGKVRELEGRLEEVSRRLAALTPSSPSPAEIGPKAPGIDAGDAPQDVPTPVPTPAVTPEAPAPAPAPVQTTTAASAAAHPPAQDAKPAVAVAGASPGPTQPAPAAAAMASEAATPPVPKATPETAPAPAASPAQALPKPSGKGSWSVVIDSFAEEPVAEQRSVQIARMGLPAEVRWYMAKDQIRYRVVVPGYATQETANTAAAELRRRKAGNAWVTRLPKQE